MHVAIATDGEHDDGLVPLLNSLASNTKATVHAHIILTGKSSEDVAQYRKVSRSAACQHSSS